MKTYSGQLRQMPVTATAWATLLRAPLPSLALLLQQQRELRQKCQSLGKRENARAGTRKKVQARSGLVLKPFSRTKRVLSCGCCSHTRIVSQGCLLYIQYYGIILHRLLCTLCRIYFEYIFRGQSFYLYFAFGGMQHAGL